MPFKKPGSSNQYAWVTLPNGARRQLSLGTPDERTARKVEGWLSDLGERGDLRGVLHAVYDRALTPLDAFRLGETGAVKAVAARKAEADNPDLRPLLDAWQADEKSDGVGSIDAYRENVEAIFPKAEPFRLSDLNAMDVRKRINALKVQSPTKNRYASAIKSLARWLKLNGHVTGNPLLEMEGWSENTSPIRILSVEEAQRVLASLPAWAQGPAACMAGMGWEFAACEHATAKDFHLGADTPRALARGTKNEWRTRMTVILQPWTLPYLVAAVSGKIGDALVFDGLRADSLTHCLQRALKRLTLGHATSHDWRHSHAVWGLEAGEMPTTMAHQLGHKDTELLWKRYGRYVTTLRHYKSVPVAAPVVEASKADGESTKTVTSLGYSFGDSSR